MTEYLNLYEFDEPYPADLWGRAPERPKAIRMVASYLAGLREESTPTKDDEQHAIEIVDALRKCAILPDKPRPHGG